MGFYIEHGDPAVKDKYEPTIRLYGTILAITLLTLHNYFLYCVYCYFYAYRILMLLAYWAFGIFMFEWAWYNTQRIHNVDEERDSCFPAFRRSEASQWRKWMFYPGVLTVMPMRLWICSLITPYTALCGKLFTIGLPDDARPIVGWRKFWIDVTYKSGYLTVLVIHLMWQFDVELDYDYTEWLGPDYKNKQQLPKAVSMIIIAPHTTWPDTIIPGGVHNPCFCVKAESASVPVLAGILKGQQGFYIDRSDG